MVSTRRRQSTNEKRIHYPGLDRPQENTQVGFRKRFVWLLVYSDLVSKKIDDGNEVFLLPVLVVIDRRYEQPTQDCRTTTRRLLLYQFIPPSIIADIRLNCREESDCSEVANDTSEDKRC